MLRGDRIAGLKLEKSSMKKSLKKLKRLELVELIYQLRKENIELLRHNQELEKQLKKSEDLVTAYANRSDEEILSRIEAMLADLLRAQTKAE